MTPNEAFRNTNFVMSANLSPSNINRANNYGFSNPQVNAQQLIPQMASAERKLDEQLAGFRGMDMFFMDNLAIPTPQFVDQSPLANSVPSGQGGPGWEAYAGAAASVGSELYYSKTYGTWMGKNFKIYQQTWGGNGIAGGKNKFGKTTSNGFKWAGRLVGAYSGYRTIEQRVNGEIGTGWMLAELGTTGVSTFGGLYGAAWGIGWEAGRFITSMEWYQEAKFNFWYNHWESQVGPPSQSNEALWYYFYQNYKP